LGSGWSHDGREEQARGDNGAIDELEPHGFS
jgi:hypothetical protein